MRIEDAAGRAIAYVYFEVDPARTDISKRQLEPEARETAQRIARALTDGGAGG